MVYEPASNVCATTHSTAAHHHSLSATVENQNKANARIRIVPHSFLFLSNSHAGRLFLVCHNVWKTWKKSCKKIIGMCGSRNECREESARENKKIREEYESNTKRVYFVRCMYEMRSAREKRKCREEACEVGRAESALFVHAISLFSLFYHISLSFYWCVCDWESVCGQRESRALIAVSMATKMSILAALFEKI